jgi:hypothetical protein
VLQVVPYYMTGFESVAKSSEEVLPFVPGHLGRVEALCLGAWMLLGVALHARARDATANAKG